MWIAQNGAVALCALRYGRQIRIPRGKVLTRPCRTWRGVIIILPDYEHRALGHGGDAARLHGDLGARPAGFAVVDVPDDFVGRLNDLDAALLVVVERPENRVIATHLFVSCMCVVHPHAYHSRGT